ncbi:NAD(P)H-binding protein [Nocardia sp. NPDC059091]|uniref:NAD(P)H-binding protein n=1 Tax=unclassified Nocardia TaxID=2637762 RepID=UPI0036968955
MTYPTAITLVLGATGKTGSRVASRLRAAGIGVRTAARTGADVRFDWGDARTYAPALAGAERVYLVGPVGRIDFAGQVAAFLDQAEAAGVGHLTYLSAYGVDAAPPEMATRSVELDLIGRTGLSHTILRPAWFMQNFSETFLAPVNGVIAVPTGNGAEAFIDADDIAAVASATLADPAAHAGAQYTLTGPEAITVADAAAIISRVSGTTVTHLDIDRDEWIAAAIAGGIPDEYASVLRMLTETIASGHGSRPTGDVEKVTGSAPTDFTDFAHRTAAAWSKETAR